MDSPVDELGPRRGRPRKFQAPSRAITLTLPDHVIDALSALDPDLSRAVVRLTQPELAKRPHPPAELARFGQRAVIVVNPSRTLEQKTGVSLVPLPDGRALISFERPRTIAELELMIADAIDDHRLSRTDQAMFKAIEADSARGAPVEGRHAAAAEHHRARIPPAPRSPSPRPARRARSTAKVSP